MATFAGSAGRRPGLRCRFTTFPENGTNEMSYAPTATGISTCQVSRLDSGSSVVSRCWVWSSTDCRVASVWVSRYLRSAVTAAMSNMASPTSVIVSTATSTWTRSLPRPGALITLVITIS